MKINGKTFNEPNTEYCVIPRGKGEDIVFVAQALLSWDEFHKLCPEPQPPKRVKPDKSVELNFQDPTYVESIGRYAARRGSYLILKSLEATPGLEWETVVMTDPRTWENWHKELEAAKFSHTEIQRIQNAVYTANCLNERRVQEAREHFLAGLANSPVESSTPSSEQATS